ncbi:hypothetical protein IMZ48_33590, partial [Candidatus Bathyarchaeota archaeon]|nr:hypothetical protein [Candidatus Bathyarchaeota archaeon]
MTFLSRVCTTAFLHDQRQLLKTNRPRRTSTTFAAWRHRTRRARSSQQPPSTPTLFQTIRRRRSRPFARDCRSLAQLTAVEIERYRDEAETETMAREPLSASPPDDEAMPTATTNRSHRHHSSVASFPSYNSRPSSMSMEMAPPPTPSDAPRSSRSTSSASRTTNRLSITLPIAPPTSDPSRPHAPSHPSVPGTPVRQPAQQSTSPADASELIIAIAAQERRVMELREELGRAEADLNKIKRQWSTHEAYRKSDRKPGEPLRPAPQPEASR